MSSRGRYFDSILLVTILSQIVASCLISITCPCGTGENAVNYTLCINDTSEENRTCEKLVNCETCEFNSTDCLTCPVDRYGPNCEETKVKDKICSDPGTPAFASRENINGTNESSTRFFLEGETLYFYCDDDNYIIEGAYVLNCTSSGDWSDALPKCQKVEEEETCPDPGIPEGGGRRNGAGLNVEEEREFLEGETLQYFCKDKDFVLDGNSSTTCTSFGIWSHSLPSCIKPEKKKVTCPDPGALEFGIRQDDAGSFVHEERDFVEGESLHFFCNNDAFVLEGYQSITCRSIGIWTHPPPRCVNAEKVEDEKEVCPDIGMPEGGYRQNADGIDETEERDFLEGETIYFYCNDEDSVLEGNPVTTCTSFGFWSDPPPRCVNAERAVYCTDPGPVRYGVVTSYFNTDPGSFQYDGRTLHINNPSIPPFHSKRIYNGDKYTVGSVLKYECFTGYRLEGRRFLTCSHTGRWLEDKPICVPISIDTGFNLWFRHTPNYRQNLRPDFFAL